ncbi:MAG: ATP-binding cassette domain-containing protein [Spirochaetaceae bacterium]
MIKWHNLNHRFDDKIIYDNFNLEVKTGEKILIKGNSGCGKSTLFKVALGLLVPDSGTIIANNLELNPQSITEIRKQIFYLDQDVNLPNIEVSEILKQILDYKNNKLTYSENIVLEMFEEFRLEKDILYKNVKDLSGGERQRIGIIIGLLLDRPIWLLDEPTSALDTELKEKVFKKLTEKTITMLVTSHDGCWNGLKQYKWGEK